MTGPTTGGSPARDSAPGGTPDSARWVVDNSGWTAPVDGEADLGDVAEWGQVVDVAWTDADPVYGARSGGQHG